LEFSFSFRSLLSTKYESRKCPQVWNHPEADKIFCEEIDVGEQSPREIASGLRGHYELSDMQDKMVLVVCNLKSAKIVGFTSNGMVLAAKSEDGKRVELVEPPSGAIVGERVFIDGFSGDPHSSAQVKKKKTWETVAKNLKTDDEGLASWDGKIISVKAGPCRVASLKNAPIS
jgi:tRNA-binding EMAP/Myf-like protein